MRAKTVKASELEAQYEERTCPAGKIREVFKEEEKATFPGLDTKDCAESANKLVSLANSSTAPGITNELALQLPPII